MDAKASPPLGGTRALVQSLLPSLVPSEQRVAQVCIDEWDRIPTMSAAEVARSAQVSPATVIRACQRMGFAGYQELRELLIRDLGVATGREEPGPDVPQHPVERLFSRAISGIQGALGALDFEAFDAAAERIRDCRRLLIVGNGTSLPAAQSVALHFLSTGKRCENPVDIMSQHISAKLLQPGDVCLAVSDSGTNQFTLRSVHNAVAGGATVIGITSYAKSELATLSDYALVAGAEFHTWKDYAVTGNIVQMLLLSALHGAALGVDPSARAAREGALEVVRTAIFPTAPE